jgi:hypothetical protein
MATSYAVAEADWRTWRIALKRSMFSIPFDPTRSRVSQYIVEGSK